MPLKAETTAENKQVMEQTAESRKIEIQLVLVRIMKARKVRFFSRFLLFTTKSIFNAQSRSGLFFQTLTLQQLISEALNLLSKRFIPQISDIKAQVDHLIDRDYLERGETRGVLNYLA